MYPSYMVGAQWLLTHCIYIYIYKSIDLIIVCNKFAYVPGAKSPRLLNALWWCLTIVGPQYETYFKSRFRGKYIGVPARFLENFGTSHAEPNSWDTCFKSLSVWLTLVKNLFKFDFFFLRFHYFRGIKSCYEYNNFYNVIINNIIICYNYFLIFTYFLLKA
jgi:hypothetical protein